MTPDKFYEKEVVAGKKEGGARTYWMELFLTSPSCAPERWDLSLRNGEPKNPHIRFTDLGEALRAMVALDNPELISRAYTFLTSKSNYGWKPAKPEEVYEGIQLAALPPIDHPGVVQAIMKNPDLALYLDTLPKSLSPEERREIIEKRIPWP